MRIQSPLFVSSTVGPQTAQTQPEPAATPSQVPALPASGDSASPAPGPQPVAPGDVQVSLEQKIATVLDRAGVASLKTFMSSESIEAQAMTPGNTVSFEKALGQALESFLTDDEDIESPLSLMSDMFEDPSAKLLAFLNDGSTRISLVTTDAGRDDHGAYPAEHGESVENNWVFALTLPEFSDHLFWAIIPRNGEEPYNYGFN